MDAKIRVMLADASAEFRLLLREALEETGEFQVVGETGDGSQVRRWRRRRIRRSC